VVPNLWAGTPRVLGVISWCLKILIASLRVLFLQPALGFLLSPQKQAERGTSYNVEENVDSFSISEPAEPRNAITIMCEVRDFLI
jgi:hypothetical protein